jgi:hypothetical protein
LLIETAISGTEAPIVAVERADLTPSAPKAMPFELANGMPGRFSEW